MPTTAEGLAFLAANAKEQGVTQLASGLQYKILQRAADLASAKSPLKDTPCECHYVGTLIDGTEFDSSIKRGKPATFAPSQVVKGWTEAMQLMAEGDKWRLFLPSELAYGDRARGQHITPGAVLIFELEILKVNGDVAAGTAARASVQKPNLAPPPPPPHAAVGCRVKVDGLAAKPQYNGLLGTVISWDGDKGRAGVKMDSGEGGAGLMLKPANLLSSDAPPPSAPRSPFIVSALRFVHPRRTHSATWLLPLVRSYVRLNPLFWQLFLHGLGDTGRGWSHLPQELRLPKGVRYSFPDAPVQPVSCNGGQRMTSWMDLQSIPVQPGDPDDVVGLEASRKAIHALIDKEVASGTPSTDIVVGGFSQGGAMALLAGYSYPKPLAAVVCLSGWPVLVDDFLPRVTGGANATTPAFVAHGAQDQVVVPACGAQAKELLKSAGVPTCFNVAYPMKHSACPSEMEDLRDWLGPLLN